MSCRATTTSFTARQRCTCQRCGVNCVCAGAFEHAGRCLQVADKHKMSVCPSIACVGSQCNTAPLACFYCAARVVCAINSYMLFATLRCLHSPVASPKKRHPRDSRRDRTEQRAQARKNKRGETRARGGRERERESGPSVCVPVSCPGPNYDSDF